MAALGSVVEDDTVAVSLIAVPCTVPAFTFSTTGKLAVPGAKLGLVQRMVPALPAVGNVQDQPPGIGLSEKNVVFGGVASVKDALIAVLGPPLVTPCVYVMLLPACTGTGLPVLVTDRSAEPATRTLTEALLLLGFGSAAETIESIWVMIEPEVAAALTVRTKVKFAVAPAPRLAIVQVRVPTLQVHPAVPVNDTAVVPDGAVSVSVIVFAVAGPPLVTLWV